MLGCEIDFLIKGLDPKTRSIVASRKEAMLKKRQIFYLDKDASGMPKVYEDRIVQARVIAVAEKVVRAEIFGVETSILARDLSFDWMGDARERFQVGDHILVRILDVRADSPEQVIVHADVKSVEGNTSKENMKKCKIQENTPELWKTSIKAPSLSGSPSVSMPLPTPAMTAGQSGKRIRYPLW